MRRCQGITEPYWTSLSEDDRFSWKLLSFAVTIVINALFITKTGNPYIDWPLNVLTSLFSLSVIQTQRSYSRFSPKYRKRIIRLIVSLGSGAVATLGVAIYSQIGLLSVAIAFSNQVLPILKHSSSPLEKVIVICSFLIAVPIALIRPFRQLKLNELIFKLPRSGLIQLFVFKRIKATSPGLFAYFELSVLLVCLVYASSAAQIAKNAMILFNIH